MKKTDSRKHLAHIDAYLRPEREGAISLKFEEFLKPQAKKTHSFPSLLRLSDKHSSGVFFGRLPNDPDHFVGMPESADGNLIIIGGNGSGKSRGIAMPTLQTWHGAICATDIKGELSQQYERMLLTGAVQRDFLTFDPTQVDSPSYDPFWWLQADEEINLISNLEDIVHTILPLSSSDNQPFWVETERGVFAAALLYCFQHDLGFSQAICWITKQTLSNLIKHLSQSSDARIGMLLGQITKMKDETLAAIDRGLRNKLIPFAVDPQISHALRGQREQAPCFTWDDLKQRQIFLRVPLYKVDQWACVINLMYTQLFHYLERRPEQYTLAANEHPPLLLLMDEFARFGKLNMITAALSTLRSKKVHISLFVQSVAQLDRFYGAEERRIIFDNCQYQVILRASDPETQDYLCKCIGTSIQRQHSISRQYDHKQKKLGFSAQISEARQRIIEPHELSFLQHVLLLTPYGFLQAEKTFLLDNTSVSQSAHSLDISESDSCKNKNGGVKMKPVEQRAYEASRRLAENQARQRRVQHKTDSRRNYIIGELVVQYFPALLEIEPGNSRDENSERFAELEGILAALSESPDLLQALRDDAEQRAGCPVNSADV